MNLEDLIMLGQARGIDLKRVAGGSTPNSGPTVRRRKRSKDERKQANGRPLYESAKGAQTRVARYPAWSLAELGQAAGGVPRLPWLAIQFSIAGDRTPATFEELHDGLLAEAQILRGLLRWPRKVVGVGGARRAYLEDLAELVLDEEQHQDVFRRHADLYPAYFGVEAPVWKHRLFEPFDRLKCVYQGWRGTAMSMIQRMITSREALDEAG